MYPVSEMQYSGQPLPDSIAIRTVQEFQPLFEFMLFTGMQEVTIKASLNALRHYYFKLVSENGFNNQAFQELMQFTADFLVYDRKTNGRPITQAAVADGISFCVTLLTSMQIIHHPELRNNVGREVVSACDQNTQLFQSLKQELVNMHPNAPVVIVGHVNNMGPQNGHPAVPMQGGYPSNYPDHRFNPTFDPRFQQQQFHGQQGGFRDPRYNFQPRATYDGRGQQMQNHSSFTQPSGNVHGGGNNTLGERFSNNLEPRERQAPVDTRNMSLHPAGGSPNNGQRNNNLDFYADRNDTRYVSSYDKTEPAPEVPVVADVEVKAKKAAHVDTEELKIEGGTEMNRAKHTIRYFGGTEEPLEPAMSLLRRDATALTGVMRAADEDAGNLAVDNNTYIESSVRLAADFIRSNMLSRLGETAQRAYRASTYVVKTFPYSKTVAEFAQRLQKTKGAADFVSIVKDGMALVSEKAHDDPERREINALVSAVDRELTQRVNEYMRLWLRTRCKIDSFVEDVMELPNYLYQEYGSRFSTAYLQFQNVLFEEAFLDLDTDAMETIANSVPKRPANGGGFIIMSKICVFTMLPQTDKELGLQFTEPTAELDPHTTPSLYSLAMSSQGFKPDETDTDVLNNFFVTADNVIYQLHTNCLSGSTNALISRYNAE